MGCGLFLLKLYNTLTRKLELFDPLNDKEVKMYTCGPSTYQPSHIGNYRTFLFEDILQRYLEYRGFKVNRLITLTDVEDKTISQAKKESKSIQEITKRNEKIFFDTSKLLKLKRPQHAVRASTIIDQSVKLIEELLQKNLAYRHNYQGAENIYYDPLKFSGFGKLSHLDMSEWPKKKRRFHKDTYPGTPWNKGDFVLWHGCKEDDAVCWETALGRGRPAWNVQDAAIVTKHLGFNVDIACGGVDNLVRHHDYTIAVAEGVSEQRFAKYWLHGQHLLADGKKMSKSRGNVYYVEDIIMKGFEARQIRFFLIYSHYRKKQNFTFDSLSETSKKLIKVREVVNYLKDMKPRASVKGETTLSKLIIAGFEKHMDQDLDVKSAFDELSNTIGKIDFLVKNKKLSQVEAKATLDSLRKIDAVLRVIF